MKTKTIRPLLALLGILLSFNLFAQEYKLRKVADLRIESLADVVSGIIIRSGIFMRDL